MNKTVPAIIKRAMDGMGIAPCRILTAVSGGADSVCLLLALKDLGYSPHAVHVEHGIRGSESLEDCEYVRNLCVGYGIPVSVVHVNAPAAAESSSMTLEEAARELRWKALRDAADAEGISIIATAHHRMDQAETVLWNLIRGSSLSGLAGIRPVRRDGALTVIRPMLECGRDQIEDYLVQKNVSWRTDSTNADTDITRNAIRLEVLPLLEKLNPEAVSHIAQAASDILCEDEWLDARAERAWESVIISRGEGAGSDWTADRDEIKRCPGAVRRRILHRLISCCEGGRKDITRAHVLAMEDLVFGRSGRSVCFPGGVRAVSEDGILRLTRSNPEMISEIIPLDRDGTYCFPLKNSRIEAEVSYITWSGGEVPKKKYTKYLAYDTIQQNIVLRTRRPGDYIVVNSSMGRRKLKDYLIDEKVPRGERDSLPLIAQGSHVLWVVGMRISEGARVRDGVRAVRIRVKAVPSDPGGDISARESGCRSE